MYSRLYLYSDDEDVQGIRLLWGGKRLPLALQFGNLHPFAIKERIEALDLPHGHQQHISMPVFNGLIMDAAQIMCAQKVLFGEKGSQLLFRNEALSNIVTVLEPTTSVHC